MQTFFDFGRDRIGTAPENPIVKPRIIQLPTGFFVEKGYLKSNATDGIAPISKRLYQKERTCIPLDVIGRIATYCEEHDPHFLLACYLLYYCFIRPVEMTRLRIENFNIQAGTVTIPGSASKNKRTQTPAQIRFS